MCNEVARRIALGLLRDDWQDLKVRLIFPEGAPNMAPLDSIRITDPAVILRAADAPDAVEAVTRRWSWPMRSGRPLYNFRSEGRDFADPRARCLVPIDGFYEFTAPGVIAGSDLFGAAPPRAKGRKDKWHFTLAPGANPLGRDFLCVAGLWRRDPTVGEAFTLLTTRAGPDVAPYHGRQIVLLPRARWRDWLAGAPSAALIAPAPAGTLSVARV